MPTSWVRYPIKPLQHGLSTEYVSLYAPFGFSPSAVNVKIDQHSIRKPWGYSTADRTLTEKPYNIILYQLKDGTRYTVYLTSTGAYKKTAGAYSAITANANPYTIPTGERWSYAIVDDKLCFTNGNTNVQYWTGSGNCAALDSTYATRARYCIEFANRLWLADIYDAGVRDPYLLRGSKEGDPTNWTDTTAQDYPFIETDDVISGLGKGGNNIFLYKRESILIGHRSANATDPLDFDIQRRGTGCIAPWSILETLGTNVFLGRDDFYIIDGDYPRAIGEKMRYRFYDIVERTEAEKTWGFVNHWEHQCVWFTNTTDGQYAWVWDWKNNEWFIYQFPVVMTAAGTGAV
jgi:hypothetical protein